MMKKGYFALLVWILSSLLLGYIGTVFVNSQFNEKMKTLLEDRATTAHAQYDVLRRGYTKFTNFIFKEIVNQPDVALLLKKAQKASKKEKIALRKALYNKFKGLYVSMTKEHIRQLHFHLPNAISFFRFHRPSKFGDDLSSVRPTIVKVNQTLNQVSAFEEGRVFNAMRHVFPLFYKDEYVGSVEISYSLYAFVESSLQDKGNLFYHFLVKKSIYKEKVWKEEKANYAQSYLNQEYVYDKQVYNKYLDSDDFQLEGRDNILEAFSHKLKREMESEKLISQVIEYKSDYYSLVLYPVKNIKGDQVAYFMTLKKAKELKIFYQQHQELLYGVYFGSVFSGFLILVLLVSIYYRIVWLDTLAHTDALTGIYNRTFMYKKMDRHVEYARRHRSPLSIVFFDIDFFKRVNDSYGHDEGDDVLRQLTQLVTQNLREGDTFARWGGEEFMILLPNTSAESAVLLAEKLRLLIQEYTFFHGSLSCSFGVTELKDDESVDAFIKRADLFLYDAKEAGRNKVASS